jgi:hypothetical protein
MPQFYWKNMPDKELYISHNISITEGKVISDGRLLYQYQEEGEYADFGKYLYKKLGINYPKYYKMDHLCKLAFLSCEYLLKSAGEIHIPAEQISVLLANSGSTIDTDLNFIESIRSIPSPAIFVYTLPNIAIGELCIRNGWKGEDIFLIHNGFNASSLIEQTGFLFSVGSTKLCITGWTEFISSENYKACLWIVSDQRSKNSRALTEVELINDFNML